MLPKISIITPSYNQGDFVEATIHSIIDQDYENLEYIIVDGASKDKTKEILQKYLGHPSITEIISEKDKGQTDALLKGFRIATGDIFGWINSDDLLAPHALPQVADLYDRDPSIDILVGNLVVIDSAGREVGLWPRKKMTNADWRNLPQAIGQPCTFFTRQAYEKVGGLNSNLEYSMDYDLFMKFGLQNCRFHYVDEILAFFRVHDSSKTMALPYRQWKEEFKVFSQNGGNKVSPFYYWKIRGIISTIIKSKIFRKRKW